MRVQTCTLYRDRYQKHTFLYNIINPSLYEDTFIRSKDMDIDRDIELISSLRISSYTLETTYIAVFVNIKPDD